MIFQKGRVVDLLAEASAATTPYARGKKYEELLAYLFESVPGTLVVRNVTNLLGAEQVDLAISNRGGFPGLPSKFLVECKNYRDKVDSKAVGYFLFICVTRSAELAIVAAAEGLTGEPEDLSYAHSLAIAGAVLGCKLVVITTADILSLNSPAEFVALLEERYLKAWANHGVGA